MAGLNTAGAMTVDFELLISCKVLDSTETDGAGISVGIGGGVTEFAGGGSADSGDLGWSSEVGLAQVGS